MNREIKFRVWDTKLKQIIFEGFHLMGEVMAFSLIDQHCFETKGEGNSLDRWNDIEVMQFTGLHDKNGKEIYEGDCISNYEFPHIIIVGFNKESASFCGSKTQSFDTENCFWFYNDIIIEDDGWEVIGNIYENPELLNK